jgi:hypothetical protein
MVIPNRSVIYRSSESVVRSHSPAEPSCHASRLEARDQRETFKSPVNAHPPLKMGKIDGRAGGGRRATNHQYAVTHARGSLLFTHPLLMISALSVSLDGHANQDKERAGKVTHQLRY